MGAMSARKQAKQTDYDPEDDDSRYRTRLPNSTRKYNQPALHDTNDDPVTDGAFIQRRRASAEPTSNTGMMPRVAPPPPVQLKATRSRHFPIMAVVLGMIVMALLAYGLSVFGAWWHVHQDDATYGRPRTFQVDAVVGHSDSAATPSHFIFINLNRHVEIIEMPGGDGSHASIYTGPTLFGDGQDLTPITGEFRDVNGDGKPDLIVHIQDQRIVFINNGKTFRPLQPGEHINI